MQSRLLSVGLLACAVGCGPPPSSVELSELLTFGVDPEVEASALRRAFESAGWETVAVRAGPQATALAFRRGLQRAVRVVSRRGVVAALDSHEPDGVQPRHGEVGLWVGSLPLDLDGDGREEVVLLRRRGGRGCVAVLRIESEGRPVAVALEAPEVRRDACVEEVEDLDGDGVPELLVILRWPELALEGEVPSLRVPLTPEDGRYRAGAPTEAWLRGEGGVVEESLARARGSLESSAVQRLAVLRAALAHLRGASLARQVRLYDEAVGGLVWTPGEARILDRTRRFLAAGWRPPLASLGEGR